MAKLTADFDYSDAELLALFREAFAKITVTGGSYKFGDREFTSHDLPEIRKTIAWLEQRVNAAASGPIAINKLQLKRAT